MCRQSELCPLAVAKQFSMTFVFNVQLVKPENLKVFFLVKSDFPGNLSSNFIAAP